MQSVVRRSSIRVLLCLLLFAIPSTVSAGLAKAFNSAKVREAIVKNMGYRYDLAAVAIFQDEAPYLAEWIEYHKLLGVEHFYMYNNLSTDNYKEVLQPYIDSGDVELIEWKFRSNNVAQFDKVQCNAYRNALKRARFKAKWLAIIDVDEFLVPATVNDLPTFLADYENDQVAAVLGYWVVFGTSYVAKVPANKLMIETLLLNGGWGHDHFKSIVRPERTTDVTSPHFSIFFDNYVAVALPQSLMQINHYWARDEDFLFNVKIPRREKWGTPKSTTVHWATSQNGNTPAGVPILRFVPELRRRMRLP